MNRVAVEFFNTDDGDGFIAVLTDSEKLGKFIIDTVKENNTSNIENVYYFIIPYEKSRMVIDYIFDGG